MRVFLLATVVISAFVLKVLGGPIGLSHDDGLALAPHPPAGAEVTPARCNGRGQCVEVDSNVSCDLDVCLTSEVHQVVGKPCQCPAPSSTGTAPEASSSPVVIGWFCSKDLKCSYKVGNATQNAGGRHECETDLCFDQLPSTSLATVLLRTSSRTWSFILLQLRSLILESWFCTDDFMCTHHPGNATQNAGGIHHCKNPRCVTPSDVGAPCDCHNVSSTATTLPGPTNSSIVYPILPGFSCIGHICEGPRVTGGHARVCLDSRCLPNNADNQPCGCPDGVDYDPGRTSSVRPGTGRPTASHPGSTLPPKPTMGPSTPPYPLPNCTSSHSASSHGTGKGHGTLTRETPVPSSHGTGVLPPHAPSTRHNTTGTHSPITTPGPVVARAASSPTKTVTITVPCISPKVNPKPPYNYICPGDPDCKPVLNTNPPGGVICS
ncbi:uncharacterized protein AB675_2956 [Cyphellophora attinorum]|uniref:Uncharacterized protein n=1 Tax=Cyphellophora attinorum TaxID=1664694 RepID=A0A0N1H4S9_9EURO|nr:uncharacterized protein AB675_2956 [Phialophora attinorum]KPI36463.1 hypothetical protein AB675_2956 [Phialophora attinorum]